MSYMSKFYLYMTLIAVATMAGMYLVATNAIGSETKWSVLKAHAQANQTLVQVGNWCSGTIIDKDKGYVVTAAHCAEVAHVKRIDKITREDSGHTFTVKLDYFEPIIVTRYIFSDTGDETGRIQYTTKVIAATFPTDIAILENVSEEKFPAGVRLSVAPIRFDDKVYTVGNPLMFIHSISEGKVTKPKHSMNFGFGDVVTIVFDAYMNRGSSGGGLFNDNGQLIGITNWGLPGGPFLASPASNVLAVLKTLPNKSDKIASIK